MARERVNGAPRKENILVVDDDLPTLQMIEQLLQGNGYRTHLSLTSRDALRNFEQEDIDLVLVDYFMPDANGIEIMKGLRKTKPAVPIIMLTAARDVKVAVEAMRRGAFNYLTKPIDPDELLVTIEKAAEGNRLTQDNQRLRNELGEKYRFDQIVGESDPLKEVLKLVTRAAQVRSTVLITGASGTGKELIAKAIHYNSDRRGKPFIKVNCAAIPEPLLESELFGIEKNVATNVDKRIGKFEASNGGSIFLDEIGDMSLMTQAKVLRVLQEKEVDRLGGQAPIPLDIRVIAATNKNLEKSIERKEFREDLFYRLNVFPIHLPGLRERPADIPLLADYFLEKFCREYGVPKKKISEETMRKMMSHPWHGNIRELENSIERGVVMTPEPVIGVGIFSFQNGDRESPAAVPAAKREVNGKNLTDKVSDFERGLIQDALDRHQGRQNLAAKELGISERSMWYKIKKLDIPTRKGSD